MISSIKSSTENSTLGISLTRGSTSGIYSIGGLDLGIWKISRKWEEERSLRDYISFP